MATFRLVARIMGVSSDAGISAVCLVWIKVSVVTAPDVKRAGADLKGLGNTNVMFFLEDKPNNICFG